MSACQPADTPVEEGLKLCVETNQVSVDKKEISEARWKIDIFSPH